MKNIPCKLNSQEMKNIFLISTKATRNGPNTGRTGRSTHLLKTKLYIHSTHSSKCKPTKEKGSEDCLWTHVFTFL